jgi:hypothetical protein
MKKIIIVICLLTAALPLTAGHHKADSVHENPFNSGLRLAVLGDLGKWDLLADLTLEYRGEEPFQTDITAGAYYRIHRNLKGGLFYTIQTGALHDEDWVKRDDEEHWEWKDTSGRLEHLISADLTPRFLLPFLPGSNWTVSLKNRYILNLSEELQSYQFLPLLNWFRLRNREPVFNTSVGYGLYVPLNFSDAPLYRHGPWLSILYHISPALKAEVRAKYMITSWTVESSAGDKTVATDSVSLILGLIWTPDFGG